MFLAALTALVLSSAPASAQNMALDPQVRAHVGVSMVEGPNGVGVTGGLDARLTRIIALDVGAFAAPIPIDPAYEWTGGDVTTPEYYQLRHGVYVAPGLRIPHAQPKKWAWDVFLRAGGGVVWTANLSPDAPLDEDAFSIRPRPAGLGGADALVRFGSIGVRASGKAYMFDVVQTVPVKSYFTVKTQWGIEALVQW